MRPQNKQVLLASRPVGEVQENNFEIVETVVPSLSEGQFLIKNLYLSLDPYMRGRMNDARSYAKPVNVGDVMEGQALGEVVESNHPRFQVGDTVLSRSGWQAYFLTEGKGIQKVDPQLVSKSAYLGVVGMPGVTAYVGLLDLAQPKPGETVVVSAASGAVGSVVGQIAKMKGCRAVGIAGGPEKCKYVLEELGFDACVDYKEGQLHQQLKEATPDRIDVYFDNVGGEITDTVFSRLNAFSRVSLCGAISQYNSSQPYGLKNYGARAGRKWLHAGFPCLPGF